MSRMSNDYDCSVKLKAGNTGSAVLIRQEGEYYLLTAAHVCERQAEEKPIKVTNIEGTELEFSDFKRIVSPSKTGADVCIMRLPGDVAISLAKDVRCATFEGSGFPCEIDGFPSNAIDKRVRIETGCYIDKGSEVSDALYVKLSETRSDGQRLEDVKNGFSGSGVFIDSNGEKYLIGIIYRVEHDNNLFIGWKMQKINEILKGEGWKEIPLIPIELRQRIIEQYNNLIRNSNFVLSRIKEKIIGEVQLPRLDYKVQIENALKDNNVVIITGDAGAGKSVLAKEVLTNSQFKSIAIVGDDLDEKDENGILSHWKINDRLQDIYKSPIWGNGEKVLLVESAERMLNGNTDSAIVFIDNLLNETPDLKVVFTIRKNSLNLFRVSLLGNGIHVPESCVIEVGPLSQEELEIVEGSISSIKPYISSDKTCEILKNPFYLNLACAIASDKDLSGLSGNRFKDMLCRLIVSGKHGDTNLATQRINALIDISRRTSKVGMNLVKCEMTDAVLSLFNDNVLVGDKGKALLRPSHDILTDWGLYCHIDDFYRKYESKEESLVHFYENVDVNIASRNVFRQYMEERISAEEQGLVEFISESFVFGISDFFYDDLFYAILISEKGSSLLTSIKPVLLNDNSLLLKRLSVALSYMFRKVDWNVRDFLKNNGVVEEGIKIRNSDYMLPSGKGWYTFVTFLYENRDAFDTASSELIPLLLQCELVGFTQEEAPNLKKYVFSILADHVNQILSDEKKYRKPDKDVIRLLFKWMDENPELIKSWVEKAIEAESHKYDVIKEFLLLSEGLEALRFIYTYPEVYKKVIRIEWMGKDGLVDDYYPMIHQASGITTTYKCLFYSRHADAIVFLCDLLNEDIEKKKNNPKNQLQEVKVKVNDTQRSVWGNDALWREYRGVNYQSHVRESLLMTFEKWLMDSINNHINKAPHALSKESLMAVFDIVYNSCVNVSVWGVLSSAAMRFPEVVGLKAMPIYSCREFILWDKTRLSTELTRPMINPHVSNAVKKEAFANYNLPHRKLDLEKVILTMSMTKGFAEDFRKLVKGFKDNATTYLEKVSASRMDINQYEIVGKTDDGFIVQGSPFDDIKEEAEQNEILRNQFNKIIETSNFSRKNYDDDSYDFSEWKEAYNVHKGQKGFLESKGLIAALGVKKYWNELGKKERKWCKDSIIDETIQYINTHQYQIDTEYSSEGLLYLLEKEPKDKELMRTIHYLIGSIRENDAMFERFEKTFISLIWKEHKEIAKNIILQFLGDDSILRETVDRFINVSKLIPADVVDDDIEEMVTVYCKQYFDRLTENKDDYYMRVSDMRIEVFCAEYMLTMPLRRKTFIEDVWLATGLKHIKRLYDRREKPILSVFNHYCYVANATNKDNFWLLWEIMFDWYKKNNSEDVLCALLFGFDIMRPDLLNDWDVLEGSNEHINKLLSIIPSEGVPYLSRLLCRFGFKSLMPDSLRYIDKDLLRMASRDRKTMKRWQDAVEDLYDDAKTREAIRRDGTLRAAYVEILNGLISNGSAIAYMIRDYYI